VQTRAPDDSKVINRSWGNRFEKSKLGVIFYENNAYRIKEINLKKLIIHNIQKR
jgi:hypothetical protein